MANRILCVAEKPAIAKSVANHLAGGNVNVVSQLTGSNHNDRKLLKCDQRSIAGNQFVKNYEFDFVFGPPWGSCCVTMTSVIGHLTGLDFDQQYRHWKSCRPGQLFDLPVFEKVDPVE